MFRTLRGRGGGRGLLKLSIFSTLPYRSHRYDSHDHPIIPMTRVDCEVPDDKHARKDSDSASTRRRVGAPRKPCTCSLAKNVDVVTSYHDVRYLYRCEQVFVLVRYGTSSGTSGGTKTRRTSAIDELTRPSGVAGYSWALDNSGACAGARRPPCHPRPCVCQSLCLFASPAATPDDSRRIRSADLRRISALMLLHAAPMKGSHVWHSP